MVVVAVVVVALASVVRRIVAVLGMELIEVVVVAPAISPAVGMPWRVAIEMRIEVMAVTMAMAVSTG